MSNTPTAEIPLSPCICNAFWIQTEEKEGDFYDPENKYPRDNTGKKFRWMWSGCPRHAGHSNKRDPSPAQLQALKNCNTITSIEYIYPNSIIRDAKYALQKHLRSGQAGPGER